MAAATAILTVFAASAPLTLAANHPGEKEVEVDLTNKSKKVIKWTETDDIGNAVSKHYEITTENGETTAYEIDAFGNKTEVDTSEIEDLKGFNRFELGSGSDKVKILKFGDGKGMTLKGDGSHRLIIKNHTIEGKSGFGKDLEFPMGLDGDKHKFVLERLTDGKDAKVFAFSTDENIDIVTDHNGFFFGDETHTKSLVTAAEGILARADTDNLSSNARKKLEKAQKALEDAREAIEADSR